MVLHIKRPSTQRVTTAGILVSAGLVLHYVESLLPVFQILPGGKIGIANIVTLLAFSWHGAGFALLVGLLRCFLSSLFSGAVTSVLYSGVGTFGSIFIMALVKKLFPRQISAIGRSMLGAFSFNVGQIAVCAFVLENIYVFSYLPFLTVLAAICGLLTGIIASRTEGVIHLYNRSLS